MKILHSDGSVDERYTCNKEFLGHEHPQFAVRFCDELIGTCWSNLKARDIALAHQRKRMEALDV